MHPAARSRAGCIAIPIARSSAWRIPKDFPLTGREVVLTAPLSEEQVRSLRVGDVVLISGEVFTGRDAVHAHLMKNAPPVDMHGSVLYHCGPVMLKQGDDWMVKAAGPTTSSREEPYQATIIEKYGVRAVIGKGGMGKKTLAALEKSRRGVSERASAARRNFTRARSRRCWACICSSSEFRKRCGICA